MKINPLIVKAKKFSTRNTLNTQQSLITYAKDFIVNDILSALEKDVKHCLRKPYAPFPAILFCFSVIDLLGALYAGEAAQKTKTKIKASGIIKSTSRQPRTTRNTARYMKRFMKYKMESIHLLWGIFRHKMVHLAQPKPAIVYKNRIIAWRYDHQTREKHLSVETLRKPMKLKGRAPYDLYCDHGFRISISKLEYDIKQSVVRKHDGYLELLRKNQNLQRNFRRAINEIYNPTKT